jgi:hypothetical protein
MKCKSCKNHISDFETVLGCFQCRKKAASHPQANLLALIDQSIRALQDEPNSGKAAVDAVEYLKKIREAVQ